jgi:hypothetical protein
MNPCVCWFEGAQYFVYFFGGLDFGGNSHFVLLRDVWNLDSKPESCRSKQARYANLATPIPT